MKTIKYSIIFSIFFVALLSAQEKYTGNVGIGTDNPQNNLDIRGNLKLTPDDVNTTDNYSPLMRVQNGEAGEHKIVSGSSIGNNVKDKSYYEFDLIVKSKNTGVPGCKFNTHIPVSEYNLMLINSTMEDHNGNAAAVSHIDPSLSKGSSEIKQNSPKKVFLTQEGGSYVINADYPFTHAITEDNTGKIQWHFSLLAIKKSVSVVIDPNPNYEPAKYKGGDREDEEHRYYDHYDDNGNPNNPKGNEKQSLRGDAFKLDKAMNGGAKVNPLQNY